MSKAPKADVKDAKRIQLDEWLRDEGRKPRRGQCYACTRPDRKEIEAAALHFIQRRNDGSTSLSWAAFTKQWVRPRHEGFAGTAAGLRNHMERCCGAKIKR